MTRYYEQYKNNNVRMDRKQNLMVKTIILENPSNKILLIGKLKLRWDDCVKKDFIDSYNANIET